MAKILSDPYPLTISGKLTPFYGDQPFFIEMPSEPGQTWVPVYDSAEKLHSSMKELGADISYNIKQIDVGQEFLQSLTEAGVRVMLNPYITPEGRTRWTEILFTEE